MRKIEYPEFNMLLSNVIYIKYNDGYIDNCHSLIQLYEYKIELLKTRQHLIYYNSVIKTGTISVDELKQYQIIIDNIEYVTKSIDNIVKSIYDYINHVTEIKLYTYKNSTKITSLYKLEKGYVHSYEGPAFLLDDNRRHYNQYFIYGDIVQYDDWKRHPLVRKQKLNKICSKLEIT